MKNFISGNWAQKKTYFIVVENFNSIYGLQDLLKNKVKNVFVLIIASPIDTCFLKDQKLFIEITHQNFTDVSMHLLKKVSNSLPMSINYFYRQYSIVKLHYLFNSVARIKRLFSNSYGS